MKKEEQEKQICQKKLLITTANPPDPYDCRSGTEYCSFSEIISSTNAYPWPHTGPISMPSVCLCISLSSICFSLIFCLFGFCPQKSSLGNLSAQWPFTFDDYVKHSEFSECFMMRCGCLRHSKRKVQNMNTTMVLIVTAKALNTCSSTLWWQQEFFPRSKGEGDQVKMQANHVLQFETAFKDKCQ
ncbi:hypothetical protein JOB18_044313 [Solea senegalensis]|uniref:Uncharacterized protein n=1 Tax=Solea senegalensis TaxID=28829 RepID=A0AAV6RDY8_SOLSE|nr:hypothetical protein JOB18_044313 [Solea senegalensis]